MPELPEIENLGRQLRATIVGRTVERVQARQRGLLNVSPAEATARLRGSVLSVARRAKEVIVYGERAQAWLHLGLGGRVRLAAADAAGDAPAALVFADDTALLLEQVFMGHIHVLEPAEATARERRYGPDPLEPAFDVAALRRILQRKGRAALKAVLVDQACLAGIGNFYADEVLLVAGLHPMRRAGSLSDDEVADLHRAMRSVLEEAVAAGGEIGYVGLDGAPGGYRPHIHRQPACGRCGGSTAELRIGGRVTTVCPVCQPMPREASRA